MTEYNCADCGEWCEENKIRIHDGEQLCDSCYVEVLLGKIERLKKDMCGRYKQQEYYERLISENEAYKQRIKELEKALKLAITGYTKEANRGQINYNFKNTGMYEWLMYVLENKEK